MVVLQGVSTDLAGLLTSGNLVLSPFAGAETLKGGTGADSLVGKTDNDTYIVNNAGDRISDPGGADDRILASIGIDLLANAATYAGIEHGVLPSFSVRPLDSARPSRRQGFVQRTLLGGTALGLGVTVKPPVPALRQRIPLPTATPECFNARR